MSSFISCIAAYIIITYRKLSPNYTSKIKYQGGFAKSKQREGRRLGSKPRQYEENSYKKLNKNSDFIQNE